jgi:hypothetical protein
MAEQDLNTSVEETEHVVPIATSATSAMTQQLAALQEQISQLQRLVSKQQSREPSERTPTHSSITPSKLEELSDKTKGQNLKLKPPKLRGSSVNEFITWRVL